ncbi:hypothetical protein MMC06_001027 [Schaereria dolodes]|nr:hypothetical protein [Schaereria dolodes]
MSALKGDNATLERRTPFTPGAFPPDLDNTDSRTVISSQYSLTQALHARRAESTRSHKIRVKVGSWNVAACPGTWRDVGAWFIGGKGVSENLSGLHVSDEDRPAKANGGATVPENDIEDVSRQEERRTKKESTIPKNDPGLLPGGEDIGIYVLGLQEIVDISSATEALRPYSDPHPARKWKRAVAEALPPGYQRVAEQQLIGLLLLIYASPLIAPTITSVSTTSVGTGLMGYMGNKGAVTARIVLGETTRMVFINCHLAAGTEKGSVERRNWDASQILSRTKFDPVNGEGDVIEEFSEEIGDEDFAFWFGDLNYRLDDLPGDDVRRLLLLHTRNEYDRGHQDSVSKIERELASPTKSFHARRDNESRTSLDSQGSSQTTINASSESSSITLPNSDALDPASDPTSLQTTISSLIPHDQLYLQMRTGKAFHDGWREGPIDFLPTYKYDVGSVGMFDSSDKKRGPSWCDRILYRTRRDRIEYEKRVRDDEGAKRKDEEMKARGLDKADDDVLFDYDPDADGEEYDEQNSAVADPHLVTTKAGFADRLSLDYYTSHQRVLSSDHKPLDAVFTLEYDAVDPELKAKIHEEVVRELDKAENEGRPAITVVVDHHTDVDQGIDQPDDGINFGHVRYDHPQVRNVTVANTGRVPATFGFVDRPVHEGELNGLSPSWLTIKFDRPSDNNNQNPGALQQHTIEPGDALNIELTIQVNDIDLVRRLNEGSAQIDDVLVLRIQNGRDHFLPIHGKWLQSSFGRSLDKLTRIPEGGVRRLQHQRPDDSSHDDDDNGVKWSAPREIFRLTQTIEELVERALAEWGMKEDEKEKPPWDVAIGWPFVRESWSSQGTAREELKSSVREALDTDEGFAFSHDVGVIQKVEVLADTLVTFLECLSDGVVIESSWQELEDGMQERERERERAKVPLLPSSAEEQRAWILDVLSASPAHSVAFTFTTFMLARVADELAPLRSLPSSPTVISTAKPAGRDRGLSQDPVVEKRRLVDRTLATLFAGVMIRAPLPSRGRERKASEERRREVIEVFLRSKWEE